MQDKVMKAYQDVAFATSRYIQSHNDSFETYPLELVRHALGGVADLYGVDLDKYAEVLHENNDISAGAAALTGDDLVLMRICGTLSQNLADLAACMYDPEAGLQIADVLGRFLGAIMIIQEFENA